MLLVSAIPLPVLLLIGEPVDQVLADGTVHCYLFNPAYNALLTVLAMPFAIYTTGRTSDGDDRMLADLSYIIYLLYWAAMQWFFAISKSFLHRLPATATCFVLIPTVAFAIWRWFDHPINIARSRWVDKRS